MFEDMLPSMAVETADRRFSTKSTKRFAPLLGIRGQGAKLTMAHESHVFNSVLQRDRRGCLRIGMRAQLVHMGAWRSATPRARSGLTEPG